uniref:Uncharacterized protein n=1 Tax=Cacopsylla melanoneura TaxID=428564 RepID=A0A8D8Y9G0_9HEMI
MGIMLNKINKGRKDSKSTVQLNKTRNETVKPIQEERTRAKEDGKFPAETKKKTYFILGDSQARNVGNHIANIHNNVESSFRSYVGPGADMTRVIDCGLKSWREELVQKEENQLVIFAGTIDCCHPLQWKTIEQSLYKLKQISEKNHVTIILVPYSINNRYLNTNAYELNRYIWNFFKHVKNVSMIDTNNVINNHKFYKYDQYHLNELGRQILARKIYDVIEQNIAYSHDPDMPHSSVSNLY